MDLLASLLPFLKLLVAFVLMLAGMRQKLGMALSILLGGIVLGLIFGLELTRVAAVGVLALGQQKFLFLAAIVGLIMVLSTGLELSGQSQRLMQSLSGYLVSSRLRLIFFPALIGLLPMPGGAIFSAPMVQTVGKELNMANEDQAVINYWFRHVWEMAWPLYPGIILTVALADIPIFALISKTWPGVVAMFVFGRIFLLRQKVVQGVNHEIAPTGAKRQLSAVLWEGLPLLFAIGGAIILETMLARLAPGVAFEWGVIVALLAANLVVMLQNRLGRTFLRQVLGRKNLWAMVGVIAAIFVFKAIMQGAGIVEEMAGAGGGGAALVAAAVVLPFLVGMVAGINVAFVGATFPLLIGLLQNLGMEAQLVPYLVLASFAGFAGVMISPLHICFVLTCKFFGADVAATWRRLILPCFFFSLTGGVWFWLLLA